MFPSPGSRYNRPQTQIAFRGIAQRAVGRITVVGSRSGAHSGRLMADSDGNGASFLPSRSFLAGETVTVQTRLHILGARHGRFSFAIGDVAPLIPNGKLGGIPRSGANGVMRFASEPSLKPAALTITSDSAPAAEGDIFLAPQNGPVQDGPMIVDPAGHLVWFSPYPVSKNLFVNDFRVQQLHDQTVLTWWQGFRNTGFGQSRGVGVIIDRRYHRIATVRAADGLDAGSHEFLVTPEGDAYFTASSPVRLPGSHRLTIDSVIQEIDIRTGLVLFDWHALDHVPLAQSYSAAASLSGTFDPYHANSVALEPDGNLVVSLRNTSTVYGIDHRTGRVLWTLGGKHSTFKLGPGVRTYLQHDAEVQPDGTLTIFDNGGWPPFVHPESRGIRVRLDFHTKTASLVASYDHSPPVQSAVQGGVQVLGDGNVFVGWGYQPFFSEYDAGGHQIMTARFVQRVRSYRGYRFVWHAQPTTPPAIAVASAGGGATRVYASWNGATEVASWRVLAGVQRSVLAPVATAPRANFETAIVVNASPGYFAVQALDANGQVLGTSRVVHST